jgi:hypothetical protein
MNDPEPWDEAALRQLPIAYGVALRLARDGVPATDIARLLGVEPEAVGPLLDVARAKHAELLTRGPQGP